jgi:hypothetical protein
MQSALAAPVVKPAIIVRLDFATGAVRVHSGVGNLSFNSETYTGLGALGAVADIVETIDGVGMFGIPTEDWIGKKAREFVLTHWGHVRYWPDVYGGASAQRIYERAWR